MELRHLRYFAAVADTGNLSKAAEKLFISQPPLSVQIRQLEEELGVALFIRHHKGVVLTEAGHKLLPQARDLLERARRMTDPEHDAPGASGSEIAMGYVPSASSTVIPELVRQLRRDHPTLAIQLREMTSDEQIEALVAGHIDAGITRNVARHVRVRVACATADPFCLAVPLAELRGKQAAASWDLRQFAKHDFVAFTRHKGPAYFDQSIHLCSNAGFSPRIRYEASTVHGVLDLVGAGLGVALVPASACLLGIKGLRVCPLRHKATGEVLALSRRKSDANPLLDEVERALNGIFVAMARRMSARLQALR